MSVEPSEPIEPRTDVERKLKSLLHERLDGLSARIRQWLEESHARAGSLADIIEQARNEPLLVEPGLVPSTAAQLPGGADATHELASFAQDVEGATDQVAILGRLVSGAATQAGRVVLFVVRDGVFVGWFARGLAAGTNPRKIRVPLDDETLLGRAHARCRSLVEAIHLHENNEPLARLLGEGPVESMLASPLWVRDRIVAVLYADSGGPAGAWSPDAIRVMVTLTALSLEVLPARAKFPRPAAGPNPSAADDEPAQVDESASPTTETAGNGEPSQTEEAEAEVDPEEQRLHEEARRFARLLVSEILLYNEREIEEGRRNKDLYQRLKEDIDRSRHMYLNRLTLTGAPDYFLQELVRTLADGDESALNVPWG